jgi:hypothetical protein
MLTYYDGASGERAELSRRTVANWTAKTANYLADELELDPDAHVGIALPVHWLTAVLVLGCWAAGLQTTFDPAASSSEVVFGGTGAGDPPGLVPVDLDRPALAGAGGGGLVTDLLACPDVFTDRAEPGGVLHESAERSWTGAALAEAALAAAGAGRVVCTADPATPRGFRGGLLAPLGGGGAVLCRNVTAAQLERIAVTERAVVTAGPILPGLPELGPG